MNDGRIVPASKPTSGKPVSDRKLLLVFQYWEGDKSTVEDLACLVSDLERVKNTSTDILLFARHDATLISPSVVAKLQAKFGKVMQARCRRRASGYPYGANAMFYDLVGLLAQFDPYRSEYYAFLNLESDCVPTCQGWLGKLAAAYHAAFDAGKACIGHVQPENAMPHMNGVAVYAIDIWSRVGASKLDGGPPHVAYDMYQGKTLLPFALDTELIRLDYNKPTITAEELFASKAVLYHGVKDASARTAVRAKFVSFEGKKDLSGETVFTYFEPRCNATVEQQSILTLWDQAWRSRGWNPVVLKRRDAIGHRRYREVMQTVAKLPFMGDRRVLEDRMVRWLALSLAGGGLLSEYDVIPEDFPPQAIVNGTGFGGSSLVYAKGEYLNYLIENLASYEAKPEDVRNGQPHVDEAQVVSNLLVDPRSEIAMFSTVNSLKSKAIHFSRFAIDTTQSRGLPKSAVMRKYLQGEL